MKNGRQQKGQTIQRQILQGYFLLTAIIAFLVVISILCLFLTRQGYTKVSEYQKQQQAAQQVITAHYKWLEQLSDSITTGTEFQGSINPDTCALGKWLDGVSNQLYSDPEMASALSSIIEPHREIHQQAAELIKESKVDRDAAYARYSTEFKPKVEIIGQGLQAISDRFQTHADEIAANTRLTATLSNILLILTGVLAMILSLLVGRRQSRRIATPILTVARWSQELATGVDNLTLDDQGAETHAVEINRMISSFQEMAESIRSNVRVIQRIAEGDLTAYVHISSPGDSLGRNLYHLVQNNDFTFSNLLRVADSVATNAGHIASASQSLAESSSTQASAVEILSSSVEKANSLASNNVERSHHAALAIGDMGQAVEDGQNRMDKLVGAVNDISKSSEKIALVMNSINDIAFQTNLLALNAAVEAARAGMAGKGFAVVADEVRNLAAKSAQAADQSRLLIEDTIQKAGEGSRMASETSETFGNIVTRTSEITGKMAEISSASREQQDCMTEIHDEITRISAVVTENAATSEQTAAATQQMNANAEVIRGELRRFNLRKREPGKPYIPPEKAHDQEFIRVANENYQKYLASSSFSEPDYTASSLRS